MTVHPVHPVHPMQARPRRGRWALAAGALCAALVLTGCGTVGDGGDDDAVVVFAAASLQGSFDALAARFRDRNPDVALAPIRYDGSQRLATQALDGAPADVLAFANEASLKPVTAAGVAGSGTIFATNTLRIAVAPGNPKHITSLADLARPGVAVVLCAPEVPCGAASQTLLDEDGVALTPLSAETNVTSVVNRVQSGEADAGLVYATDIAAARGRLGSVTPANAGAVINRYPIAVSRTAAPAAGAREFADFVLSPQGRAILAEYGFGAP